MKKPDSKEVRAWAEEFFKKNSGASTNQCLKAMNNARVPPLADIVKQVHLEHQQERLRSMLTTPAMPEVPNGPRLVVPAVEEEPEPMAPTPAPQPVPPTPVEPPASPETRDLAEASRALLLAMRKHGIESCILTCQDLPPETRADWEVTYKKRAIGGVKL